MNGDPATFITADNALEQSLEKKYKAEKELPSHERIETQEVCCWAFRNGDYGLFPCQSD